MKQQENQTPWQQIKSGCVMIVKGIARIIWGLLRLVDVFVRRYPYAVVIVCILITVITAAVCIGKARSERDALNKKNYQLQQKLDTVLMIDEAKHESKFYYHGAETYQRKEGKK